MILKNNHKFTKEERKVISGLLCDLDELDNKPRRLYSALRDFALVFFKGDEYYKDKSRHSDIIMSIEEAEERYYLGNSIQTTILYSLNSDINDIIRERAKHAYENGKEFDEYETRQILGSLAMKIAAKIFRE